MPPPETMAPRRTALITGSGRNIGRAVALALAADGLNIVVNGLNQRVPCEETAEAVRAHGVEAIVAMGDVGTSEGCDKVAGAGIARFGAIDVLVPNAAIRPASPFLEMDGAEWRRVLQVTLIGRFWPSRPCLPGLCAAGVGRVPARHAPDGITLLEAQGIGAEDVAAARVIYEAARERGLGIEIPL